MRKYVYGLLFLLLMIISALFYFKKDIEATIHISNKIEYSVSVNVQIGNWILTENNKNQRLRIISHGIPISIGDIRFNKLGFKIINGDFNKNKGIKSKGHFKEKLNRNQNILIALILVIMVFIIIKR